jgi:pilus assembly protein CpaC
MMTEMSAISRTQACRRRHLTWAGFRAGALFILVLSLICLTGLPNGLQSAQAADQQILDTSGVQQDGRFLRLGIAKSAVVKLPAAAKDVIVGNEAVVDVVLRNRNTAYLFARAAGQTNIFIFGADGQEILHLDLEVTLDTKALKKLIDRAMPGNQIEVDSTGGSIVLKGLVPDAQQARTAEDLARRFVKGSLPAAGGSAPKENEEVLNLLKIAEGDQVMLKVKVVELKRTIMKQLGINLSGSFSAAGIDFKFNNRTTGLNLPDGPEIGNLADFAGKYVNGGTSIDAVVRALESQDLATVLAEPTLTAVSGAPANFHAGGEYPYTVCQDNVGDLAATCSVEFKPFGVSLAFTPTVLSGQRIGLNVRTEVSEIADKVLGNPVLDTRNAQTSIEVPSGGSVMLAGLIRDVSRQKLQGTPGIKSVPILGALFSSRDYQRNQTELVVIVTPYLVKAVQEKQLATPLDGYNQPTDLQQIFLGRLNRVYGVPGETVPGTYHGKVGHIID